MCSRKFKVKEFFNVNPKYLLEGYSVMEVGIYNNTKNKASSSLGKYIEEDYYYV